MAPINKNEWTEAERIADTPEVAELLQSFSEDPTGDCGTMIVRAVMHALAAQSSAAIDVLAERRRQIETEGMTTTEDDHYQPSELPRAAAAYIRNGFDRSHNPDWPWPISWWKPSDARSNYVRAGALILAEIERLDRASAN